MAGPLVLPELEVTVSTCTRLPVFVHTRKGGGAQTTLVEGNGRAVVAVRSFGPETVNGHKTTIGLQRKSEIVIVACR